MIFLEPTRLYRLFRREVADDGAPLDACFTLRDGSDLTLVSWGAMLQETLAAAGQLEQEGISAAVIDVATLKAARSRHHPGVGGTHRPLRDRARGAAHGRLRRGDRRPGRCRPLLLAAPVLRVTGYDTVVPLARQEALYMPSVARIVDAARRAMAA